MSLEQKTLYQRLPEIYRIKDEEQTPPGQLRAYVDILDSVHQALRDNIEALYHDQFIETCDDWVIPYIADLLGVSHLAGDSWTLRADVARTVHHRRRKGTQGALESVTYALSGWAVHTVELYRKLLWSQHLNHQRPDLGGQASIPLTIQRQGYIGGAVSGGTVNLRDPALLSFFNGPFDPFAHGADVKPSSIKELRYNLPNLAIFLWRLRDYTVPLTQPLLYHADGLSEVNLTPVVAPADPKVYALRFDLHALAEPMALFNTHRFSADQEPPDITSMDAVPGVMPTARLNQDTPTGNPDSYIALDFYDSVAYAPGDDHVGLTLHISDTFTAEAWQIHGANLCAWEQGVNPVPEAYQVFVDPEHGRLMITVAGVNPADEADVLAASLLVSATIAASGSSSGAVGALPLVRDAVAATVNIDYSSGSSAGLSLQEALAAAATQTEDELIIEIDDSRVYPLDLELVSGAINANGWTLNLGRSLTIRAASGQRPVIQLVKPLGFRPLDVSDPSLENLNVMLQGLYISWDHSSGVYAASDPLINRVALNQLELINCTLDPGNHRALDGLRQDNRYAFILDNLYGFDDSNAPDSELVIFDQTPHIILKRCISGSAAIDDGYTLQLQDSIIDAQNETTTTVDWAVHAATGNIMDNWGPALTVDGVTCFGGMRVESATGQGAIWWQDLHVHDDQQGCIKFSYFAGIDDILPQHQGCVQGLPISFTSKVFGEAGYAQLKLRSHRKILEQGPGRDEMGAYGFLSNSHRWKNINIRYREYMPVGINPVLVPVT